MANYFGMEDSKEFKDPFTEDGLVHREGKPEPANGEQRFYYYYNRKSGGMKLRMGGREYVFTHVDLEVDCWTVAMTNDPLKRVVAGNARRLTIENDIATLS